MKARARSYPWLALIGGGLVVALVSCSSDGGSGGASGTGSLSVTIAGLPTSVAGSVRVESGSFSKTVTGSGTLGSLTPGTYTITPQSVTYRRNVFDGAADSPTLTVSAGETASVGVSYAAERGDLWVGDRSGSIYRFLAADLEKSSPAPAQTSFPSYYPEAIAFDGQGNLWAGEYSLSSSYDVELFRVSGASVTAYPDSFTSLLAPDTWGLAFDSAGNLWATGNATDNTREFDGASLTTSPSQVGFLSNDLDGPRGAAFDTGGNLWVVNDGTAASVVMYRSADLASSTAAAYYTHTKGFVDPYGLAFDQDGNLWVANGDNTVLRFDLGWLHTDGTPNAVVTVGGTGTTTNGVAFDVQGNLWVTFPQSVREYAAADISASGAFAVSAAQQITGLTYGDSAAFDPPPYNLPVSQP